MRRGRRKRQNGLGTRCRVILAQLGKDTGARAGVDMVDGGKGAGMLFVRRRQI